ncbi:CP4-57 prophage protein [Escherichia coli]|nr:CP4-57 prophage protein [Escherichia coli]
MRLASRFGYANQIRRDRPLTHEELMHYVPGFSGKINTRPEARTIRTSHITVLESLQREGFQPFFACQTRVRDPGRRGYTKHMLRLRRAGEINGEHVPEIILLTLMTVLQLPDAAGYFSSSARTAASVVSLWGSTCSAPGKCGGQSH